MNVLFNKLATKMQMVFILYLFIDLTLFEINIRKD